MSVAVGLPMVYAGVTGIQKELYKKLWAINRKTGGGKKKERREKFSCRPFGMVSIKVTNFFPITKSLVWLKNKFKAAATLLYLLPQQEPAAIRTYQKLPAIFYDPLGPTYTI